jgi:hypothetical protein
MAMNGAERTVWGLGLLALSWSWVGCGSSTSDGRLGELCLSDATCALGYFCERPAGMCGATFGTCQGDLATADCVRGPAVCGCDGKTYAGDCPRLQAGVSKSHDGPCSPDVP